MKDIYKKIEEIKRENREAYVVTVIRVRGTTSSSVGQKMVVEKSGKFYGTIGGGEVEYEIRKLLMSEEIEGPLLAGINLYGEKKKFNFDGRVINTESMCGGFVEVFIEPLFVRDRLYIIGGGHCGMELSTLGAKCNFFTTVIDSRKEWLTEEKHPLAHKRVMCDFSKISEHIEFSNSTYVVVMTPEHRYDKVVIKELSGKKLRYLGMMGSVYKVKKIFEELIEEGIKKDFLKKIFAPIGFPINSRTPVEIAISVMSQIIAVKNGIEEIKFSENPFLKKY